MRRLHTLSYPNIIVLPGCFIAVLFALSYLPGMDFDLQFWRDWSTYMFYHGLQNVYETDADYMPLFQYVLYVYAKICGGPQAIHDNIGYLRLFTLAFDWLGLWYVYLWTGRKIPYYLLVLISLVNIGHSYNTLFWAQVDGIHSTLAFISVYYGYHKKPVLSTAFFILALNMKLQSGVFLPLWGYFYLSNALETKRPKEFFLPLLAAAAVQLLILLPFLDKLPRIWHVVEASFGRYAIVSWSASNFWYLAVGYSAATLADTGIYLFNMTYKQVGLLLFFIVSAIALFPLLRRLVKQLFARATTGVSREQVWLIGAIIAVSFFFFPTEMHERYSHPAFLFIFAYAVYKNDYFPYLLFSFAYFCNVERGLVFMKLNYRTFIFDHQAIAGGYAIVLLYLLFRLWKTSTERTKFPIPNQPFN